MKVFTRFQGKDKKINKMFAWVFFVSLLLSLLAVFKSPTVDELNLVNGTLKRYECRVLNSRSKTEIVDIQIVEESGSISSLEFIKECKNQPLEPKIGEKVSARYDSGLFGRNKIAYEVILGGKEVLNYKSRRKEDFMLPFGVMIVFGFPWLIWAFVKVGRS